LWAADRAFARVPVGAFIFGETLWIFLSSSSLLSLYLNSDLILNNPFFQAKVPCIVSILSTHQLKQPLLKTRITFLLYHDHNEDSVRCASFRCHHQRCIR
jgi:hypothetical protein